MLDWLKPPVVCETATLPNCGVSSLWFEMSAVGCPIDESKLQRLNISELQERICATTQSPNSAQSQAMICQARIQESRWLTEAILQLKVRPEDEGFSWLAGQWIDFSCVIEGQEQVAGYSICSAAGQGSFELLVRKSSHPVSAWLHSADRGGASVLIQGGAGRCVYLPNQHPEVVCLAGGIGVAPIVSILRTARLHQQPATFYHSVRHRDELVFADEFPSAQVIVTSEDQRLDFPTVARQHGGHPHYFVCGPRSFIDEAVSLLPQHGAINVHCERWW